MKTKTDGRIDKFGVWDEIRSRWLEQFRDRDSVADECVKTSVTASDEWCAEAYLETDYAKLTEAHFQEQVRQFLIHKMAAGGSASEGELE